MAIDEVMGVKIKDYDSVIQSKYKCEFDCSEFKTEYVADIPKIKIGILSGKTINKDKVFVFFVPNTKADAMTPKRVRPILPTIKIIIIFIRKLRDIFSINIIIGVIIMRGSIIDSQ